MRALSLKLPDALERQLARLAQKRQMSRSALIREAIEAFTVRSRTSVTAAATDLVGSLKGPVDLSTSSKHLDGYGQ